MTKPELMELVGKTVIAYLKDSETGLYGILNYADEFLAKHEYRKPNYFYIGNTSFKLSHVRKIEELKGYNYNMKFLFELTEAEQKQICHVHYHNTHSCGTCPLKIDGDICTRDISDDKTTLR